tara:strand:- start:9 stop:215 length:207 start_codon:yes stop_codon:yes gene_type:complete
MEYTMNASCEDCGFEWQSDYKEYMVDDIPMDHYCNCKNNCDEGCDDCEVEECALVLTTHYKDDESEVE